MTKKLDELYVKALAAAKKEQSRSKAENILDTAILPDGRKVDFH